MERKQKNSNNQERTYMNVSSFEVKRVHDSGRIIFFDLDLNGVMIYGCRVVEGQRGDFIGFPTQKGKDGKYYNIVYAALNETDSKAILDKVQSML